MRILSRIVIVLLVLGGLGFGSYSFGQHVLSTRLFGSSVVPNASSSFSAVDSSRSVTRKTDYKGSAPHVEIEVLDADSDGPGPQAPSLENLRKSSSQRNASVQQDIPNATIKRGKPRRFDAPDADGFRGSGEMREREDEDRPRRRRRRRVRTSAERTAQNSARETIARRDSADANEGNSRENSDSGATVLPESGSSDSSSSSGERSVERRANDSSSDSGRSVSSGSSSRDERPTRRRRRVRTNSGSPGRERSPSRAPRESPVPVAEDSGGSSGGDSPVPQPE